MKKSAGITVLCLLCCIISNTAYAGGGGLSGIATEATQMMNNSELIKQVSQLSEQIQNQITMIQDIDQ